MTDSKGYYAVLGVSQTATDDDIKAAFRKQVKLYHPDIADGEKARETYMLLTEAYRTLLDPLKRKAYDALPDAAATLHYEFVKCCKCGKPAKQPRYLFFTRGNERIGGVYCRDCASKEQLKTSLHNWGDFLKRPAYTWSALKSTYKFSQMPPDKNWEILMQNAQAYQSRKRPDLARAMGEQAKKFAQTAQQEIKTCIFLNALPETTVKEQDSWRVKPSDFVRVYLPLLIGFLIAVAGVAVPCFRTDRLPAPAVFAPKDYKHIPLKPVSLAQNDKSLYFFTTAPQTPGYQAPCVDCGIIVLIPEKTPVRLTGIVPDSPWVQIKTPRGIVAFVKKDFLTREIDEP